MGPETLSGGIVVALAAALWLAYLLPSWLRRREYIATERNAVRLQQTLRILAETAEVPEQVRVEATAREVAVQQRLLKKAEERALAEATARAQADADRRSAELAAAMAAQAEAEALIAEASVRAAQLAAESKVAAAQAALMDAPVAAGSVSPAADAVRSRRRRVRRARAATSLAMLAGLVFVGYGTTAVVATGSWMFLVSGLALLVAAVGVQSRLARAGRMRPITVAAVRPTPSTELYDHAEHDEVVEEVEPATWTPQPLPKPLYLSRGTIAASAMASVDAAKELRRAAAREDLERRARELAPVAELRPRPASAVAAATADAAPAAVEAGAATDGSRFARMGVLEDVTSESIDLDAVLRRRRAAS